MKQRIATMMMIALASGALAGCGGDDESAEPEAPETATVTVTLVDAVPLQVLQNENDIQCRSSSLLASLSGAAVTPVEVTLRDAAGVVVGTQTLPEVGGSMDADKTCTWPVVFTVEHSDFYEATVLAEQTDVTATGQTTDGAAAITLTL